MAQGSFQMLLSDDEQVYAFQRRLDSELWLVLGNFTAAEVEVRLPDAPAWAAAELLIGNYPADAAPGLRLRPWECRVYRRTAVPA